MEKITVYALKINISSNIMGTSNNFGVFFPIIFQGRLHDIKDKSLPFLSYDLFQPKDKCKEKKLQQNRIKQNKNSRRVQYQNP